MDKSKYVICDYNIITLVILAFYNEKLQYFFIILFLFIKLLFNAQREMFLIFRKFSLKVFV